MRALLIALLLAAQQPDDVAQRINAATALVDAGKLDEGIAALKRIVADHPEDETAKYELALTYMAKGDADNCRKVLEPIADTAKQPALILAMLGNCLDELGQSDKAIDVYRRGLKVAPTSVDLNFNLAVTLAQKGKLDEARELLKTDTRANPWHASGHLFLARIFESQNFRVPAVFSYLHFLALDPSPRAKDAAARLNELLNLGVKETGKGANITIDPSVPKSEGDYGGMATGLALAAASKSLEKNAGLSDFEKARQQVVSVVKMFTELTGDHKDYTAEVHGPFFAAMRKENLIDVFAAAVVAPLGLNGFEEWRRSHDADIARWNNWIKPQLRRPALQAPGR